jgi:hypothetical protein
MIAGLTSDERASLARVIHHAVSRRTVVVDLRELYGPAPPGSGSPIVELTLEGLTRFMREAPAVAADCRTLLALHAQRRGH